MFVFLGPAFYILYVEQIKSIITLKLWPWLALLTALFDMTPQKEVQLNSLMQPNASATPEGCRIKSALNWGLGKDNKFGICLGIQHVANSQSSGQKKSE